VNRREFVAAGCACGAALASGLARAQADWQAPARFVRPDIASDEGGLWAIMDREETRLRRSPFALRDQQLRDYVQGIACKLAGDHCPDVRVHLFRTPYFNASMAPNGMMMVWTGLMLRVENEAQLAAVMGHEIGHYYRRHSVEQLRDAKARSAFGQFLGLLGPVGAIGAMATLAGQFAYSREHEREADMIGLALMRKAGYDPAEAAKVWGNLLLEIKARPDRDAEFSMFATHPGMEERQETLKQLAQSTPGGSTNSQVWEERTRSFRREWLADEIKRGQYEESVALLTRMITNSPGQSDFLCARGEVYRLRAKDKDLDSAIADFQLAISTGGEPPETHRGLGAIYRLRKQVPEARASYQRYLEAAPNAADAPMIKSYLEEMGT
jgi:predicted Zn-dependent protease